MIMAKHTTGKKKTESVEETLCSFHGFLCDIVISVYMCVVLLVLPLYNKGYAQIGTEKENFFRKTMTYGEIAAEAARQQGLAKMSAQAVGGAVGHNPISLMIPCHRVVGTNGSLTGYGGGIQRKKALLELERADMHGLFVPKKGTAL